MFRNFHKVFIKRETAIFSGGFLAIGIGFYVGHFCYCKELKMNKYVEYDKSFGKYVIFTTSGSTISFLIYGLLPGIITTPGIILSPLLIAYLIPTWLISKFMHNQAIKQIES